MTTYRVARLGNGTALHLADDHGILCNRWGSVNGVWKPLKVVKGAHWTDATCMRCYRLKNKKAAEQ